jgi:sulfatase maturation enzyme AslB (radical SAM superfamily)
MGLQPITMMSQSHKILHLEPTTACNAECPQCARETDLTFDKSDTKQLTVEQITKLISNDTIKNLDKMFMCGDYGDPAAGMQTIDIYKYFRRVNPSIALGMNSNGGVRNVKWWNELGSILNQPKDYVVFSIDGLEDTNHIYRVNVKWDKVIKNAKAFISAGGLAHWDMLVFEHNKHQINQAQDLAKDLGFKWFRAKVSRRFNLFPVKFLQPPKNWQDPVVTTGVIKCQALTDASMYISASGKAYPCCYLGTTDYTLDKFDQVVSTWNTNSPNLVCYQTCNKNTQGTSFSNQWQREVEF